MLAHIHPSLQRFACKIRPVFNGLAVPGSASRTIQGPPRVQSPFARLRRYPFRRDVFCITSEGVTPPSSLLRTHAPDQHPPVLFGSPYSTGPCRLSPVPAGWWSFPTLSLQSVHRCLDPYPGMPLRCPRPFLPRELQPHPRCTDFGASITRRNATSTTTLLRGGSHFVMFRLPRSLAPQFAPTAQALCPAGSQGVYATQWTGSYLPELWYRYMTESDNDHDGTFTRWIAALSAAPCNVKVYFSFDPKFLKMVCVPNS